MPSAERRAEVLAALETLAENSPCEVEAIPDPPGSPTQEGDECRDNARIAYLLEILLCEFVNPSTTCCDDAASTYRTAYAACVD